MLTNIPFFIRFLPLLELFAFIAVCFWIGFLWALLLLVSTSVLGFLLIGRRGRNIMQQVRANPFVGAMLLLGSLQKSPVLMSGLLLLIPGFLTDILGLLCLIPRVRRFLLGKLLLMNMKAAANQPFAGQKKPIEGESTKIE